MYHHIVVVLYHRIVVVVSHRIVVVLYLRIVVVVSHCIGVVVVVPVVDSQYHHTHPVHLHQKVDLLNAPENNKTHIILY